VIRNGGVKPNIIPDLTELEFYARTATRADLELLKTKLNQCFDAAATSTGCTVRNSQVQIETMPTALINVPTSFYVT